MDFSLQIVLIDAKTKKVWQSPNHNEDKRKDDYHRIVKPIIIRRLSDKLKKDLVKIVILKLKMAKFISYLKNTIRNLEEDQIPELLPRIWAISIIERYFCNCSICQIRRMGDI